MAKRKLSKHDTDNKRQHYLLTDVTNETMICTDDFKKMFEFITKNRNAKIRTIDWTAKPNIVDRNVFLKKYLQKIKNSNNFFELANILIKRDDNRRKLISSVDLLETYDYYEQHKNDIL